jgi:hypothetical protein
MARRAIPPRRFENGTTTRRGSLPRRVKNGTKTWRGGVSPLAVSKQEQRHDEEGYAFLVMSKME